jgi:LacI family transcriptional regulator
MAVRHLLDLGHETVWHIAGPPGWMATDARLRGWAAELSARGRAVPPAIPTNDWSAQAGYQAGIQLADDPGVTAVLAANDPFALGAIKAFNERGLSVPGDVSVVGFDDLPEARFFAPSLTTVSLDFEEVGHVAVDRILTLMRGEEGKLIELIEPQLIVRESTSFPRI